MHEINTVKKRNTYNCKYNKNIKLNNDYYYR